MAQDMFQKTIADHLSKIAEQDPAFAAKLGNPKKSIDECVNFILTQVEKSGRRGFCDEEVFGMAVHYYDEENPGDIKDLADSCTIVGNWNITEEDEQAAKEAALKQIQEEMYQALKPKPVEKKKAEPKPEESNQMTLFA